MAELTYNIISVANLRDWIGFPATGPTAREVAALEAIANGVTDATEKYLGRPVVGRTRTEYLDGSGGRELALQYSPVVSITTLQSLTGHDATVYETFVAGDYLLDSEVGRVMLWSKGFPTGRKNIKVVYIPGWTLATVPANIVLGLRLWGLQLFKAWNGGAAQEEIVSQSLDGQTTVFRVDVMPKKVEGILKPYRQIVMV